MSTQPLETRPGTVSYRRDLGMGEVLSIVVGRIIGSGIFRTPGPMMMAVASVPLFFGAWVLGGVLTLLSALVYAEMAAMIPAAGGPHAYLREAFPPWWAFLRGWAMFFVSETAGIVAVSLVFAEYTVTLLQRFTSFWPAGTTLYLAWALICLHTAVNMFGVALGGRLQDILAILKAGALLFVTAAMLLGPGWEGGNTVPAAEQHHGWSAVVSVFAALRYGFFAYSGWEGATYVAEEVKEPQKTLPRSLVGGIAAVMVVYLAANAGYVYQLGAGGMMTHGKGLAAAAMEHAMGTAGVAILCVAVMVSTLGNVGTQVLVKARVWHAMARDGLFFRSVSQLHPRYQTPNRALLAQGAWATVLLLASALAVNAYEAVIDFFSFTSAVFNVSVLCAVIVLRRKQPDRPRPYRAWGYPFTAIVAVGLYTVFAAVTLYDAFIPSLMGVGITLTGLLYYRFFVPARVRAGHFGTEST